MIAGAPVSGESVTIDGVNIKDINDPRINIALIPDAIQEFQEQQSNYSAGRGMGVRCPSQSRHQIGNQ